MMKVIPETRRDIYVFIHMTPQPSLLRLIITETN